MAARRTRREHADPFEGATPAMRRLEAARRGLRRVTIVLVLLVVAAAALAWRASARVGELEDELAATSEELEEQRAMVADLVVENRAAREMVRWGELLMTPGLERFPMAPLPSGENASEEEPSGPRGVAFLDPMTRRAMLRLEGLEAIEGRRVRLHALRSRPTEGLGRLEIDEQALGTLNPTDGVAVAFLRAPEELWAFAVTDEPEEDAPDNAPPPRTLLVGRRPER